MIGAIVFLLAPWVIAFIVTTIEKGMP